MMRFWNPSSCLGIYALALLAALACNAHALAIYLLHYNFGRIHQTLRVTPAMEAKISDHVWTFEEIAKLG